MKKFWLLIMGLAFCVAVEAQPMYHEGASKYSTSRDRKSGGQVYKGSLTVEDLKKEPTFGWLQRGMNNYTLDTPVINALTERLQPYDITVFLGTWCDDSHTMIPRMLKVLEASKYKGNLTMYGVDRDKTTGLGEEKKYNINRIPVIILSKDGKEVGRVTEVIERSMEEDMLRALKQ